MFAWVYAYILQPLCLAYPVQLHYQQSSSDDKTSLIETLLSQCPSLYGSKAWYSPSWWMFGSGNLQTAYSAMGDFTKVDRVEYDRKVRLEQDQTYIPRCFCLQLRYSFSTYLMAA